MFILYMSEEYYRQKYLKYKAKYLDLQEQMGGAGFINKLGELFNTKGSRKEEEEERKKREEAEKQENDTKREQKIKKMKEEEKNRKEEERIQQITNVTNATNAFNALSDKINNDTDLIKYKNVKEIRGKLINISDFNNLNKEDYNNMPTEIQKCYMVKSVQPHSFDTGGSYYELTNQENLVNAINVYFSKKIKDFNDLKNLANYVYMPEYKYIDNPNNQLYKEKEEDDVEDSSKNYELIIKEHAYALRN